MPANFNALLRYKKIDECLRNRFRPCTINRMIEICSEALGEVRGRGKQISKRTIMDDLKVMKSGDLGFWAPIEQKEGVYFYTDKDYSIFKQPINEIGLLKEILFTLLEKRGGKPDEEIDKLLLRIAAITGDEIQLAKAEEEKEPETAVKEMFDSEKDICFNISNNKVSEQEQMFFDIEVSEDRIFENLISEKTFEVNNKDKSEDKPLLMIWDEILNVI